MANPEHLKILKQGVEAWNEWRRKRYINYPDLSGAFLCALMLEGVDFSGTNLRGADLSHTQFVNTSFAFADLTGAKLTGVIVRVASFMDSRLNGADLSNALLAFADFSSARLNDADFSEATLSNTVFGDNDLHKVKGLETVRHRSPSTIGIDTIYRAEGHIPEIFLRGCGVPEEFITYMRSLTLQPIQFYTCFISFTEADDAFAERLYNDLQGKGVRCWRWKEDAKWGKTLMRSIDEAVRIYDKLIVICSEQSLNSPAVIREIERALQKEDELARQGQAAEVLFPIRLDDYIFTGWQHHRKADVTAKNVGDFRRWKDHDAYSKALARLLRDLKAGI